MAQSAPYTNQQLRSLRTHKIIIAVEILAIVFLILARWIWSGWWIDWNKNGPHLTDTKSQQEYNTGEKGSSFVPPKFERDAVNGTPTVDASLGWAALTISADYSVHVCGVLNADSGRSLPVYFTNDEGNAVWSKLRVLNSNNEIIGETGLLKPGQYDEALGILVKVGEVLKQELATMGLTLIDFKIEVGYDEDGKMYVVDEITPDIWRVRDEQGNIPNQIDCAKLILDKI